MEENIESLKKKIEDLEEEKYRYIEYALQFLHLILKYQGNRISKEELFAEAKSITRPDIYKLAYHEEVTQDYMGVLCDNFDRELTEQVSEDDTDTLIVFDKKDK